MALNSPRLEGFFQENPEYRKVFSILKANERLILERWPKLKKNSSGYNLRQVVEDFGRSIFNIPALLVGSEGTLAVFGSVKLRLLPRPKEKLTARLYFDSLVKSGQAVKPLLELEPSGLEIVDGSTLNLIGREKFGIPPTAAALLLVEFDDNLQAKKRLFLELVSRLNLEAPVEFGDDPEKSAELWRARKAIVPILYRHHPQKRPIPLIEDVSLPTERIPEFIEYATSLFDSLGLTYGMYGHIGDGNLHIRPLLNLNDKNDFELALKLYDQVYNKVISMGGSTTAEHADGRLRAPLVKQMYGEQIYAIFESIKELLDPNHILSPGKILSDTPFIDNIDFEKLKSYCAACGKCNGYCPAYDIFHREDYSPRGWLRMLNQSGDSHHSLDKFLSYCLNCKNCTTVCPAGVDIAYEIINFRSTKPMLASKLMARGADSDTLLGVFLKLGRLAAPVLNAPYIKMLPELAGKRPFGLDRTVVFPSAASRNLRERYSDRIAKKGEIAFFHGCADNLLESSVGEAVFKVFDRLGIEVSLPEQKCCGLPYEVHGHRDNLIQKARFNIESLKGFAVIITGCASCLLRLKEYKTLFADNDPIRSEAENLASRCFDISQYLNHINGDYSIFDSEQPMTITYHNPCHLRAAGLHKEPEKLMGKIKNIKIIHPVYGDRCCAQAGSYGFLHFQESKKMFAAKKEDYSGINAEYLMTSCPACQMKIRAEMGTKFKVVHPVEILARRLDDR
ncbi:MAG: heterodisulfide reductase-related iron-sulfur binding cluster [candidate division Zixibacteria bacterium]|nr:heterodisulfide reductase-related iron-sulfur binding cluster [candidate division Zixibacteria bacterium]